MNADLNFSPRGGSTLPQRIEERARAVGEVAPPRQVVPEQPPAADTRKLLNLLWRYRWLFVAVVLTAIALAALMTFLTTPKYRATAVLEINQPEAQIIGAGTEAEDKIAIADPHFLTTQLGLLKGEALADRVAMTQGLVGDPTFVDLTAPQEQRLVAASAKIRQNLEVQPVDTSRLIRAQYVDVDPVRAATVTNALVDQFIAMNLERRYDATAAARSFLENRIKAVKTNLEKSERQLVQYAAREDIVFVGGRAQQGQQEDSSNSLDADSLVSLNQALAQAQNERIQAEQRFRQAGGVAGRSEVVNSSTVQTLTAERARLEAEYQQKLSRLQPDYPDMVELKARIDGLGAQIGAQVRSQAGSITNTLGADYRAAVAREEALRSRVAQLKTNVLDLRNRSVQYNILQREVDTNRTLYEGLLQRYKEIGVAGAIGSNTASIVNRAKVPLAPYSPSLILNLLAAAIGGLLLAAAISLGWEYLDDTIKSPEDIKSKLHQNALGTVPKLDAGEVFHEELLLPDTAVAEAYSSIRAAIQFSTSEGAPRSILVTSSRPGEGKSSTAFAIAYNLARLGRSVLIVDADLRKPSFRVSGSENDGLSSILTGHSDLRHGVRSTEIDGLYLIASGPIPPNPAELLASARMSELLSEAQSHFDHIVIDAPPLLGLADAPLLGSICRSTIFVVEAGSTRRMVALTALDRLKAGGAEVLGVVLTKHKHSMSGYSYDYAYYSYGHDRGGSGSYIALQTKKLL